VPTGWRYLRFLRRLLQRRTLRPRQRRAAEVRDRARRRRPGVHPVGRELHGDRRLLRGQHLPPSAGIDVRNLRAAASSSVGRGRTGRWRLRSIRPGLRKRERLLQQHPLSGSRPEPVRRNGQLPLLHSHQVATKLQRDDGQGDRRGDRHGQDRHATLSWAQSSRLGNTEHDRGRNGDERGDGGREHG